MRQDIVRDYAIRQLDAAKGLRAKQEETVTALLAARPDGGFRTAEHASPLTVEGYVARELYWHLRAAREKGEHDVPDVWVTHDDEAVLRAVARAVGYDELVGLADSAEAAGEHLRAARYAWVASKGSQAGMAVADLLYRSVDLLVLVPEAQRDDTTLAFEQASI